MFTPTHLGPSLFFFVLKPKIFNFWALFLGSVLPDLENVVMTIFIFIARPKCYPSCYHHGFFHSILGAIVGSFILTLILKRLEKLLDKLKFKQSFSFKTIFFSSLLGWLLHILADSLVHSDVFLFWPIESTPFLINWSLYWRLSHAFTALGVFSLAIIIIRMFKLRA